MHTKVFDDLHFALNYVVTPILTLCVALAGSDYVNASWVPGYSGTWTG